LHHEQVIPQPVPLRVSDVQTVVQAVWPISL
jgi:hypothetical protein